MSINVYGCGLLPSAGSIISSWPGYGYRREKKKKKKAARLLAEEKKEEMANEEAWRNLGGPQWRPEGIYG